MICWHKSPGYFWFRVFGYGVHMKRLKDCWVPPSERFGYVKYWDCCGWRFKWLTAKDF